MFRMTNVSQVNGEADLNALFTKSLFRDKTVSKTVTIIPMLFSFRQPMDFHPQKNMISGLGALVKVRRLILC